MAQIDLDRIKNEISKIIDYDTEIDFKSTPGFTVAIVDGDSSFVFGFGKSHPDVETDIDPQSVFEVGSISKSFSASLVSILDNEGILKLSDKINSHLPEKYRNPRLEDVTVNHLLTHNSGLPKLPMYIGSKQKNPQNPYADYSKIDLLKFYSDFIPEDKRKFIYSHVGYALLEIVIEHATEMEYELALQQYLLEPLQLQTTFVHKSERNEALITPGFDRAGRETLKWDYASFAGSEGIKSNIYDLIDFTKAQIGIDDDPISKVFQQNHLPEVKTHYNDHIFAGKGWHVFNQKKSFNILTHSGKTYGHRAYISFIKETRTAVIILSNSSVGTEDLGLLILRMINDNWKRKT